MKKEKSNMGRQEFEERIDGYRILDDTFMNEVFRDQPELVGMVLRTILKIQDLYVQEVRIQDQYTNWQGRGIRVDVFAKDSSGKLYDIEIQRAKHGAGAKRARFNMSIMDVAYTKPGTEIPEPEETYIIFVTETDIFDMGLPTYHIDRVIQETGELFGDCGHIVYVNGAYVGNDPIGVLMHDFRCSDPAKMKNEDLKKRVGDLKASPEWRENMCQAMEDTREEGRAEGREEGREEALAVAFRKSVELLMDLGCSRENAEKLAAAKFAEDSNATVK